MRAVQNRMLRKVCGISRGVEEEWLPWLRRATHKSRQLAVEAGVRDWVQTHALRKWLWAGHAARASSATWLWRVTFWRDSAWNTDVMEAGGQRVLRPSRRRWMKWEDPLRRFIAHSGGGVWSTAASDREQWATMAKTFVQWFSGQEYG